MTNYQTTIKNPSAIRWGSAKIEIDSSSNATPVWKDLGAVKNITATMTTSGVQKFEPDNAPPMVIDPVPDTWDWKWDMQEAWNPAVLQLLRGPIDTFTTASNRTTIGVYAGTGARPARKIRITNKSPTGDVVITLLSAKLTSEYDWNFPTDKDGTTAIALTVSVSAQLTDDGFGTIESPTLTTS